MGGYSNKVSRPLSSIRIPRSGNLRIETTRIGSRLHQWVWAEINLRLGPPELESKIVEPSAKFSNQMDGECEPRFVDSNPTTWDPVPEVVSKQPCRKFLRVLLS